MYVSFVIVIFCEIAKACANKRHIHGPFERILV